MRCSAIWAPSETGGFESYRQCRLLDDSIVCAALRVAPHGSAVGPDRILPASKGTSATGGDADERGFRWCSGPAVGTEQCVLVTHSGTRGVQRSPSGDVCSAEKADLPTETSDQLTFGSKTRRDILHSGHWRAAKTRRAEGENLPWKGLSGSCRLTSGAPDHSRRAIDVRRLLCRNNGHFRPKRDAAMGLGC